ncbi:MAG: flagellar hook-basal body complex protein FliE [Agarilytica sp.]
MSERMDINRLMMEMRALKSQTQAFNGPGALSRQDVAQQVNNVNGPKFSDLMTQAIDKVNDVQHASGALQTAYLKGDPNVDITDVMIASQKSGVAFDSMLQVRNKLVEAYKDVMNMPI